MDAVMDKETRNLSTRGSRPDAIVTARVPVEIKERGNAILRKIGSSPTELINSAYEYVLREEKLPQATPVLSELCGQHRSLTPEQKRHLKERMQKMTLKAPEGWGEKTFKELLNEAREERYARFA